jgi:hypothetical protein
MQNTVHRMSDSLCLLWLENNTSCRAASLQNGEVKGFVKVGPFCGKGLRNLLRPVT